MTNVSSTNLVHNFVGKKKDFIALISMCSITKFAKVTEIGDVVTDSER